MQHLILVLISGVFSNCFLIAVFLILSSLTCSILIPSIHWMAV